MNFETILLEEKGHICLITLNRPDKLNALNATLLTELQKALQFCANSELCHAIIITGAGPKAFAAGADIAQLHEQNAETGADFALFGQKIFSELEYMKKPVIAAVNGFALGGGCELALACHMRFSSPQAKFGQPEVNLGIIPGYGGTQRLTKLVGSAQSMELILSGAIIDAVEAQRIGLVNRVFPAETLIEECIKIAELIASKAPLAISASMDAIRAAEDLGTAEGMQFEANIFGTICGTKDFKEGTSAFLEKRAATFLGK
jgi:enoyl-CoA hydratase